MPNGLPRSKQYQRLRAAHRGKAPFRQKPVVFRGSAEIRAPESEPDFGKRSLSQAANQRDGAKVIAGEP
jgi:hypothetical protein